MAKRKPSHSQAGWQASLSSHHRTHASQARWQLAHGHGNGRACCSSAPQVIDALLPQWDLIAEVMGGHHQNNWHWCSIVTTKSIETGLRSWHWGLHWIRGRTWTSSASIHRMQRGQPNHREKVHLSKHWHRRQPQDVKLWVLICFEQNRVVLHYYFEPGWISISIHCFVSFKH